MADLSRREQMMEQRNPPALAEQYETLDRMIAEASAMVPSYARMSNSIKYAFSGFVVFRNLWQNENYLSASQAAQKAFLNCLQDALWSASNCEQAKVQAYPVRAYPSVREHLGGPM